MSIKLPRRGFSAGCVRLLASSSRGPARGKDSSAPESTKDDSSISLRALLNMLFGSNTSQRPPGAQEKRYPPLDFIGSTTKNGSGLEKPAPLAGEPNLLYWYCPDLTFAASDFARVGPPGTRLRVMRARNPVNLTRRMGYFLEFPTPEEAAEFYHNSVGHELCGFPLKLRTDVTQDALPLLEKVPGLTRQQHALILGLPPTHTELMIIRALWDYDLLDNDALAVERLPADNVKYGGDPFLLRFKTENDAARFVRDFDGRVFPHATDKVLCEVID